MNGWLMVWPQAIGSAESSHERVLEELRREEIARGALDRRKHGRIGDALRAQRQDQPRQLGLVGLGLPGRLGHALARSFGGAPPSTPFRA